MSELPPRSRGPTLGMAFRFGRGRCASPCSEGAAAHLQESAQGQRCHREGLSRPDGITDKRPLQLRRSRPEETRDASPSPAVPPRVLSPTGIVIAMPALTVVARIGFRQPTIRFRADPAHAVHWRRRTRNDIVFAPLQDTDRYVACDSPLAKEYGRSGLPGRHPTCPRAAQESATSRSVRHARWPRCTPYACRACMPGSPATGSVDSRASTMDRTGR